MTRSVAAGCMCQIDVSFKTKPDIAIDLVDEADANGVPYETITLGCRGCDPRPPKTK